jgi:hypothetical protein
MKYEPKLSLLQRGTPVERPAIPPPAPLSEKQRGTGAARKTEAIAPLSALQLATMNTRNVIGSRAATVGSLGGGDLNGTAAQLLAGSSGCGVNPKIGGPPPYVPPPPTSVWSAADAAANNVTLSNGGLTVVYHGAANWVSIRGSISKNSGQVYVEFAYTAAGVNAGYAGVGVAAATFNIADLVGDSNYSAGFQLPNNQGFSAGFTIGAYPNLTVSAVGDVVGMAIDFTAQKVWFSFNGDWQGGNPTTGAAPNYTFVLATVGALFPTWSSHGTNSTGGGTWTLQPTAASQTYAPPAGFTSWG